jgi:hypothetical protein
MQEMLKWIVRKSRKHAMKMYGRLGAIKQFDFLIIGSAKCGTTSLHSSLRSHPDIYLPSLSTSIGGETGFFLADEAESVKGLSNEAIATNTSDILTAYDGEQLIGERSTDYTKRPYRSVNIGSIDKDTAILFLYRDPVERIRKMYNHHLTNRPSETSQCFRDEDVEYYITTSMYYYQIRPWVDRFDYFCAIDVDSNNEFILRSVTDFLMVTPAEVSFDRKNINRSKKVEIDLTDDERGRLYRDFDRFLNFLESTNAVHISEN